MGKKSKRNSNNKPAPCYHGCITKKDFNYGRHHKILENYDEQSNTPEKRPEFIQTNVRLMVETKFDNFLIAHITDDYLKEKNNLLHLNRLCLLVDLRYVHIPEHEGKDVGPESKYIKHYKKYMRDITTERGRINIMAREIPCDCMEEKRIAAKLMAKVASCFCCNEEFPKKQMLRCTGCDMVQYCSKDCGKKHWPTHKDCCSEPWVVPTPAPIPAPPSVPSFGETIDFDVDADADADAEEEKV